MVDIYERAMAEYLADKLYTMGKITESEHWWFKRGWIPATATGTDQ